MDGDQIAIGSYSKSAVAGSLSNSVLSSLTATYANKTTMKALPKSATVLTLEKNGNYWNLVGDEGKLGATAVKKLAWDNGDTRWTISISNGDATIQNATSSNGRFLYNATHSRFTTYESRTSASMLLPQLYRGYSGPRVYPTALSIDGATELDVGSTAQLNLTYAPEDTNVRNATWSSSSTTVATVSSEGLVTAKKAGTVTIAASAKGENGATITATHSITVKNVDATAISLNQTSKDLGIGSSFTLTATLIPSNTTDRTIRWTSSSESVASVTSSGVVKGLTEGDATITATTANGLSASCDVHVSFIHVTSISLSPTEKEISIGRSFNLTPTLLPSNASDKAVTYSSSNASIASVDNNGKVTGIAIGEATITATAENGLTATCAVAVTEVKKDAWTILAYISGNDLESSSSYASEDITEMLSVGNQPDDVNIVIQTGGASKWARTHGISASELGRYTINNKKLTKVDGLTNASMGQVSTLQSFLEWGMAEYPAEKTALILWNHGGALNGVCYDENFKPDGTARKSDYDQEDVLTATEVLEACNGAFSSSGFDDKFEFIGYDACLMQVQDIAVRNAAIANYMVAAQESEAGKGWEYSSWLDDLYAGKETETILRAICDGFVQAFDDAYGNQYSNDQTLSFLDLSKAAAYQEAFENVASDLQSAVKSNKSSFLKLLKGCYSFGDTWFETKREAEEACSDYGYQTSWIETVKEDGETAYVIRGYYDYGTIDAYEFLSALEKSSLFNVSSIAAAKAAFADLMVYNKTGEYAADAHGVTMIFEAVSRSSWDEIYIDAESAFPTWHSIATSLA